MFQQCFWLINRVFKPYLVRFIVVFINDILIYSRSQAKHEQYLRTVLETLRRDKLYDKLSRCEFWLDKVVFLEHMISKKGIYVDPKKIEVMLK